MLLSVCWSSGVAPRCSRPPCGHAGYIGSDQRGSGGKITQRGRAPVWVSAGHRWHTARLEACSRSWWGESQGCGHGAEAVWGEEAPGCWHSIQMEAILRPLKGMACKCTPSLIPAGVPPSRPSDVWMKRSRKGSAMRKSGEEKGWCGGGEAGNLCVSFEACLMAFLCQVPLQGLSGNLALEGIRTLTIRGWVQASSLESLCISQTTPNITCDIQTLLYAEAVTREQDRTTWRYKRQSAAKEKKKKAFLFLRTAWTSNLRRAQVQEKISARNGMERLSMRWSLHNSRNFIDA